LAVVIMFREMTGPIPGRSQVVLWALVALDVMVAAWMLAGGEWLDSTMPVVTLGGHHLVVLWLAVSGFALLAGTALLTGGFAVARRWHLLLVVLSTLVSVVALAGALSVLLLLVLAVFLLALLGAAFLGKGTVLLGHLGGLFRR
jgi:hypothetical protein